ARGAAVAQPAVAAMIFNYSRLDVTPLMIVASQVCIAICVIRTARRGILLRQVKPAGILVSGSVAEQQKMASVRRCRPHADSAFAFAWYITRPMHTEQNAVAARGLLKESVAQRLREEIL